MNKQSLITLGIIVVVVVVGVLLATSNQSSQPTDDEPAATSTADAFAPDLITAAHQYNQTDGTHIVAGETEVPTPCHTLGTETAIAESAPEQVTINFETMVADPDQMCAQVITTRRFKVVFSASPAATISATYNGQPVELNLQEVGPDENLEDFEVYTKG